MRSVSGPSRSWAPYKDDIKHIIECHHTLKAAKPSLHSLAIEKKCASIALVNGYLDLAPKQVVNCKVCQHPILLVESVKGKCFDCVLIEYDALAESACGYRESRVVLL